MEMAVKKKALMIRSSRLKVFYKKGGLRRDLCQSLLFLIKLQA